MARGLSFFTGSAKSPPATCSGSVSDPRRPDRAAARTTSLGPLAAPGQSQAAPCRARRASGPTVCQAPTDRWTAVAARSGRAIRRSIRPPDRRRRGFAAGRPTACGRPTARSCSPSRRAGRQNRLAWPPAAATRPRRRRRPGWFIHGWREQATSPLRKPIACSVRAVVHARRGVGQHAQDRPAALVHQRIAGARHDAVDPGPTGSIDSNSVKPSALQARVSPTRPGPARYPLRQALRAWLARQLADLAEGPAPCPPGRQPRRTSLLADNAQHRRAPPTPRRCTRRAPGSPWPAQSPAPPTTHRNAAWRRAWSAPRRSRACRPAAR
jgi:hypothetical protein